MVFLLLDNLAPGYLVLIFAVLAGLRLAFIKLESRAVLIAALVGLGLFCALALFDTQLTVLKLYPTLINLGAAIFCIYTLLYPPSVIERISQLVGLQVDGPAVPYTRRLTMVWTGFFVINAGIAAYTALLASTSVWAWYNGLISYLLIGLMFAVEYPVRLLYRKRHRA